MYDETVVILENRRINGKYYKLAFNSRKLAAKVVPGQFLNVQIQPGTDPLLRRPFSYYRIKGSRVEILYEILGQGTGILSGKAVGTALKILGPLGQPFRDKVPGKKRIFVAGGIGLPPLVFLAERFGADFLLIGAKSKSEVLPRAELASIKGKILYSTNDGTYGTPGFVTVLLEKILQENDPSGCYVQTCGPKVMMQAVIDMAGRYGVAGEASIDENMACGVGACLGCMVETEKGLVPSCVEGPVFPFERIKQRLVPV